MCPGCGKSYIIFKTENTLFNRTKQNIYGQKDTAGWKAVGLFQIDEKEVGQILLQVNAVHGNAKLFGDRQKGHVSIPGITAFQISKTRA